MKTRQTTADRSISTNTRWAQESRIFGTAVRKTETTPWGNGVRRAFALGFSTVFAPRFFVFSMVFCMFAGGKNVVFLQVFDDFFDRKTLNSLSFFNILFFTSFRYRGTATRVPRYLNDAKKRNGNQRFSAKKTTKNLKENNVFAASKHTKNHRKSKKSRAENSGKTKGKRNSEKPRATLKNQCRSPCVQTKAPIFRFW